MDRMLEEAAKRSEAAEVFLLESHTRSVGFSNSVLKRISEKESRGAGLRVIAGGKLGHVAASRFDVPEVLAEKAASQAALGEPVAFAFPGPSEIPALSLVHEKTKALTQDEMIAVSREAVDRIRAYDSGVKVDTGYGTGWERIRIRNTVGFEGAFERLGVGFGVGATLVEEGNIVHVGRTYQGIVPPPDPGKLVDGTIKDLDVARRNVAFPSGKHRAILMPSAMADILMAFLGAISGDAVAKGTSPLKGKLGQAILDEQFTLMDDGLHPEGICSQPFDDEGLPVHRKPIVKNGVLETFLTDLKSAAKLGVEPGGNGTREKPLEREKTFSAPPFPSPWNIVLEPGTLTYEQMLAETDLGLEIHVISGILLGNLINGDFSGTLELAYCIEKGERTGRVKDVMIAGNFYSLFKDRLMGLESTSTWTGNFGGDVGAFLLPKVLVADLDAASKGA
ncbi:MAG: TldD/PmbA family protein [Planctomycetota bacterium]|jgi:PmbA protein